MATAAIQPAPQIGRDTGGERNTGTGRNPGVERNNGPECDNGAERISGTERNRGLDGVRGIAALSVALGHCVTQVTGLALWNTSLRDFPAMPAMSIVMRVLSALFPSDAAVMVFFVLSGHVLWGSFQRRQYRFL